ncbi:MAG: DUF1559 domain-containing protein [Pirellulaceae bacterium]|nr:DUF1559 domain-containing protein [Planctomycetales bacterium]
MIVKQSRGTCQAFTLVELLVVIAIVGILIALLLPAIQAAREAGRNTECKNKIRQIALAFHNFESAYGHFAGDGWGYRWVGDPDREARERQPGGWLYRILPFIEEEAITQLGRDGDPNRITPQQRAGLAEATRHHLTWFNCPTRRGARLVKLTSEYSFINMDNGGESATSSYDANWGAGPIQYITGPQTDRMDTADRMALTSPTPQPDGVVYVMSSIKTSQITDGLSKTYLVGDVFYWITDNTENPNGRGSHSQLSCYLVNSSNFPPLRDMLFDGNITRPVDRWGSAHPSTWNMAFCDASVRAMSYDIDPYLHAQFGSRNDGTILIDAEYWR